MLILELALEERLHLALALKNRQARLQRDGGHLPAALLALADTLSQPRADTSGHALPPATPRAEPEPAWIMSTAEAARLLGCSTRTLRRRAARGDVPSVMYGQHRRYRRTDLHDYVASLTSGKATA